MQWNLQITLLGNTLAQMSMLHSQGVLEEYNKDLLMFAQGREAEFLNNRSGQSFLVTSLNTRTNWQHCGRQSPQAAALAAHRIDL